jgi:iron complex outermembrane receptor protein
MGCAEGCGLTLTTRGIHSSSQYLDQANSKKIDGWERFDLGARYTFKVSDKDVTCVPASRTC